MQLNVNHTAPSGPKFQTMPLFMQLRDALLARIEAGEWRPEQAIPNEGELAREFGVSAGTMRKSLDLLESQRVLIRRQGRGTFVTDKITEDMDRIASCYCRVKETAVNVRYSDLLLERQPTEPQSLFKHRLAQALFKAGADYRKEYEEVYLATAKRELLLVVHEELASAYLKDSPDTSPKEARARTKDQVRDHLLGRDAQAASS